jgi:hypothetical protein
MARYFQYWTGAAILAALAMITPIWLIVDEKPLEAALIGIPTLSLLAWCIVATIGMLRKE